MNRTIKYAGVAVVVVLAGCMCSLAADHPSMPSGQRGDVYQTSDIWKGVDSAITPMPTVEAMQSGSAAREVGPVMATSKGGGLNSTANGASSIPGMSLGSILTPQERTNLSIRKTIRRLG